MIAKNQASWSTQVDREDNELRITSNLISTNYEANVHFKVGVQRNLIINAARWDVYRSPNCVMVRSGEIPVLIGTNIMEYSTKRVLPVLDPDLKGVLVELVSEGIRGAINAMSFVMTERDKYNELRRKILLDSCLCFSNLDLVGELWTDDMGKQYNTRKKNLFSRNKNYQIFANADGSLFSTACFADTYHELLLNLSISPFEEITKIYGTFLRSPNKICCEGEKLLNGLIGKNLAKMTKKDVAEFVGGSAGCTHILEMCYDLGMSLSVAQTSSSNRQAI